MATHLEPVEAIGVGIRFPEPDRSAAEGQLALANRRGHLDSVAVLDRLVPGMDFARLGQRVDGGTLAVGAASPGLVERLDGAVLVERLLLDQDLDAPRLKLARYGSEPDGRLVVERIRPDEVGTSRGPAGALAAALDTGTTMILDGIDHKDPGLRRLAEHVERAYRTTVNINGYVSLRPHQSFGPHWDDHEVLIVHLLGRKRWEARNPLALSPARGTHDPNTTGEPMWDAVIEPGTVLQLPRGWGHDVTGLDELTFHLTITIPRTNVVDAVQGGLLQLHHDDDVYGVVPCAADDDAPDPARLRALVTRAGERERIDELLASRLANVPSRHAQGFHSLLQALDGGTADDDLWVRAPHPGGVLMAGDGSDPVLAFGRKAVRCSGEVLDALAAALDGRAHGVAAWPVPTGLDMRAVVDEGLRVGLLDVAQAPGTDPIFDPA